MKIAVASKNPVKIHAVEMAFNPEYTSSCQISAYAVNSGVPDQPVGNQQTLMGARNRVQELISNSKSGDYSYFVGIEGGVEWIENRLFAMAWAVVSDGKKEGLARSSSFELPPAVVNLVQQGIELGTADDMVFRQNNTKQKSGAIGLLSKDMITREMLYVPIVQMALFPFKNIQLY